MSLIALMPLLGWTWLVQHKTQFGFSLALMITISGWMALGFVAGLFGQLLVVAKALWGLGLAVGLYAVLQAVRQRNIALTPALVLFVLSTLYFWLIHHGSQFYYFDEYGHWGVFIKDLWTTHEFWGPDSNALHPRYPPGAPLWQYLLTAWLPAQDASAYLAQFLLLLAPLTVLWDRLQWRQMGWAAGATAVAAIGLSNFGHGIASIYVDHVLAVWIAGCVLGWLLERPTGSRALWLTLPILAVTLIKDVGVAFAMACAAAISLGSLLTARKQRAGSRNALVASVSLGAALLAPSLLALGAWSLQRDAVGIPTETQSLTGVAAGVVLGEVSGDAPTRAAIIKNYREVFLHQQLSKDAVMAGFNEFSVPMAELFDDNWRISTAGFYMAFLVWMVLATWFATKDRALWLTTGVLMLITSLAYSGVLFASYLFAFGERGILLPSYLRYTHSAILALLLIAVAITLPQFGAFRMSDASRDSGSLRLPRPAILLSALIAWLVVLETPHMPSFVQENPKLPQRGNSDAVMAEIQTVLGSQKLWVWFPIDHANGYMGRVMQYQLAPTPTTIERDPTIIGLDPVVLRGELDDYDVVWLPVLDATAAERFGSVLGTDVSSGFVQRRIDNDGQSVWSALEFE